MKKIKLSTFIASLEKLKDTKGDVEIYPIYYDDFQGNVKFIKRASIMTKEQCREHFDSRYNLTNNAPKETLFLVFEE